MSWAFGLGALEFTGVTLGVGFVTFGIGYLIDSLFGEYRRHNWLNEDVSTTCNVIAEKAATAFAVANSEFVAGTHYAASNVATILPGSIFSAGVPVAQFNLGAQVVGGMTAAEAIGSAVTAIAVQTTMELAKHKIKSKAVEYISDTLVEAGFSSGGGNYKCPVHSNCYRVHPNGFYAKGDKSYHNENAKIGGKKSPAPIDGQLALDCSIQIKPGSAESFSRIGISCGQIVEFKRTSPGFFH